MAKKKGRRSRPKSLGKRFGRDPVGTTKREWAKLPMPAKLLVGVAALGALGGAAVASDIETRVPRSLGGGILAKTATWGSNLAARMKPNG
jgi:hypothetical protein